MKKSQKNPIEKLYRAIERATKGRLPYDAKVEVLAKVLPLAWRRESSRPGRHDTWTRANPAHGQSDATVLLVQDRIGGTIRKSDVPGYGSHYYVVSDVGVVHDFAREKFPDGTIVPGGVDISRDSLLASQEAQDSHLAARYSLLTDRFDDILRMLDNVHAALGATSAPPHRP